MAGEKRLVTVTEYQPGSKSEIENLQSEISYPGARSRNHLFAPSRSAVIP
jgi:hypothetical protein